MQVRRSLPGRPPLRISLLAACLSLAAAFQPARAQDQIPPPPQDKVKLASVAEQGSQNYSSAIAAQLSGLTVGQTVDRDEIQKAANRLASTGLFAAVRYRYDTNGAGVQVTFDLQDAPAYPIAFDNFPWFTDDEIFQALKQAGIPLQTVAPGTGDILDSMGQAIGKLLADRGITALVTHSVTVRPDTGQKIVEFRVDGASMEVASFEFSDPLVEKNKNVHEALSALIGKPFSREAIELLLAQHVRPVYLAGSYLQASFGTPEVRLVGNPQNLRSLKAAVYIVVHPGEQYSWGGVTWSGNHLFSNADLDNLATTEGLAVGHPANGEQIASLWKGLQQGYEQRGYLDAKIEPVEKADNATHVVSYAATITEGVKYRMGDLVLSGLSPESDQRVRRAWKIPQGQTFDLSYYNNFLSTGIAVALKGTPAARDTIGRYLQKNPSKATVDVMLDFQ